MCRGLEGSWGGSYDVLERPLQRSVLPWSTAVDHLLKRTTHVEESLCNAEARRDYVHWINYGRWGGEANYIVMLGMCHLKLFTAQVIVRATDGLFKYNNTVGIRVCIQQYCTKLGVWDGKREMLNESAESLNDVSGLVIADNKLAWRRVADIILLWDGI